MYVYVQNHNRYTCILRNSTSIHPSIHFICRVVGYEIIIMQKTSNLAIAVYEQSGNYNMCFAKGSQSNLPFTTQRSYVVEQLFIWLVMFRKLALAF